MTIDGLGSGYNAAAATVDQMACYWEPDVSPDPAHRNPLFYWPQVRLLTSKWGYSCRGATSASINININRNLGIVRWAMHVSRAATSSSVATDSAPFGQNLCIYRSACRWRTYTRKGTSTGRRCERSGPAGAVLKVPSAFPVTLNYSSTSKE